MGVNNLLLTYENMKKSKNVEHPVLILMVFILMVVQELKAEYDLTGKRLNAEILSNLQSELKLIVEQRWEIDAEAQAAPRVLPSGVSELFCYRLSKHIKGLRVPEIQLHESEPKRMTFLKDDLIVKLVSGGFASSRIVPRSLPIYFLAEKNDSLIPPNIAELEMKARQWIYNDLGVSKEPKALRDAAIKKLLNKQCPLSREFYEDFEEAKESDPQILNAAQWDSPQRILIHAWRAFLNSTYAHNSNVLVDNSARLWVIDHETCVFSETASEIEKIALFVSQSERLLDTCKQISCLTTWNIEEALKDIPSVFWSEGGKFERPQEAAHYFSSRLAKWKKHFPAEKV
jgi:hypothetical protein